MESRIDHAIRESVLNALAPVAAELYERYGITEDGDDDHHLWLRENLSLNIRNQAMEVIRLWPPAWIDGRTLELLQARKT
jgi:hypothetical protein